MSHPQCSNYLPPSSLPGQIARLRELRAELRSGAPIDIGTIVEPIYLSSSSARWELPGLVWKLVTSWRAAP